MNFNNLIYQLKKIGWLRFNLMSDSWRYGKKVLEYYQFLIDSQWWSKEQLEEYQWQKLKALINHAYQNSPYYKRVFDERGIKPDDIKSQDDYRKVPYLTKKDVMENYDDLKVKNIDQYKIIDIKTGGSTGVPLHMMKNQETEDMRRAIAYRSHSYAGLDFRNIDLTTWSLFSRDEEKEPLNYDPIHRTLNIRSFIPDENRLKLFIRKYQEFKPTHFIGYFQTYKIIKKYLEKMNITDIKPKAIFVQGEAFNENDREDLQKWFGCKVYDYYGMRENAVSAGECKEERMHINSEFTYVEFENNHQPAEAGESASIIGTNLYNYAMPLLRYYTGDMGRYYSEDCKCGRKLPVMKIEGGRSRDFVVISDRLVLITHHITHYLKVNSGIDKLQIYQPDKQRLIIRIVKNDQFTKQDEEKIIEALKKLTKNELVISMEYVDDILRTRLGKYRMIISDVEAEI